MPWNNVDTCAYIFCFSPGKGIQADLKTGREKEIEAFNLFVKYKFSTLNYWIVLYFFPLLKLYVLSNHGRNE